MADCTAFLSCLDTSGTIIVWGYFAILLGLLVSSVLYILTRNMGRTIPEDPTQEDTSAARRLTFHSPDDTPRNFKQEGFILSFFGAFLLYSWVVVFGIGYIYIMLVSFFIYAPAGFLWFTPMPDLLSIIHPDPSDWNARVGPYLMVFTGTHILWLVLSLLWAAMRTLFMIPAGTLDDPATYVLIEEVLDFETNATDPDGGVFNSIMSRCHTCSGALDAAARATLLKIDVDPDGVRYIEYTCVRYVYDIDAGRFKPMGIQEFKATEVHDMYAAGGLMGDHVAQLRRQCGKNSINVHVPGIIEALVNEYSDFTYAFNSIGTWSYMVYSVWNIGIFWLAMTICSGMYRALGIVRPNQQQIALLAQLTERVKILREGAWVEDDASNVVVSDIVMVEEGLGKDGKPRKLVCDGIVIEGSLVVDESMLTGEPMPIQKMPVENSKNAQVSKKNIAYAGTTCMQSMGPVEGRAIMIATSVGALTTRGQLVRMVLFPTTVRFKYNDQMPIVYGLIFVYMIFLSCIYLSPLVDLGDWIATYLMLLNTVAMCLSPMLPVSLVMGQSVGARRLKSIEIQCLQPGRIPIAGKISSMVFDKTGTITKDGMEFDSVMAVEDSSFSSTVSFGDDGSGSSKEQRVKMVPKILRNALASCHTVTTLPGGGLVGNAVECSMVQVVGWAIDAEKDTVTSPDGSEVLEMVKKLDFDHKRMTSGVIVRLRGSAELNVYVKGSYEKVQAISSPEAVPLNYQATTEGKAKQGYYVLGIATKTIPDCSPQQLADMTRDEIEGGLKVCGLLLFRNEMKPDSAAALKRLADGNIRSVMCTGDNALTGISIGHKCGIVTTERCLLGELEKDSIVWRDPDDETLGQVNIDDSDLAKLDLAVTQGAWRHLLSNGTELDRIWLRLVVFARMKPEDKINVVKYFQSRKLVVGMSGDGGNDCGGLRAAHAGLALSDAEASMVSPFSTGKNGKSLMAMAELIEEGRACISTNIATFIYFMVYCFTLTTVRTVVTVIGALNFGEFVWFLMDVGFNIGLVWTMTLSRPQEGLANYRPTATLLGPRTILGVVVPYVTCMVLIFTGILMLEQTDFWKESGGAFTPIHDISLPARLWMLRGDNFLSPVCLMMLYSTLVNTAYCNTYGGDFRANILNNWCVNIVYVALMGFIFFLSLSEPTKLNCVFRANCDTPTSLAAGKGFPWSTLAFWSAGGLGDCFLGPQVRIWQGEINSMNSDWQKTWDTTDWLPDKDIDSCYPFYLTQGNYSYVNQPALTTLEDLSTTACVGPNNCWNRNYKIVMGVLIATVMAVNHLLVKFVMQGPVAGMMRFHKPEEHIEMKEQLL